jgi:hypothetical protein
MRYSICAFCDETIFAVPWGDWESPESGTRCPARQMYPWHEPTEIFTV